jgi:hypothetical protein
MHRDAFHCHIFGKKYGVLRSSMTVVRSHEFSLIIRGPEMFTVYLVPNMCLKETTAPP